MKRSGKGEEPRAKRKELLCSFPSLFARQLFALPSLPSALCASLFALHPSSFILHPFPIGRILPKLSGKKWEDHASKNGKTLPCA